jgi:glycosyltransferase involved in cell wall biosynthesis
MNTIAYLVSQYPAVSHTFILREVLALRRRGWEVATASVRAPADSAALGPEEAAEAEETFVLKPSAAALAVRAAAAHLRLVAAHPLGWLRMAARARKWCVLEGPRSRVKALGYLAEAGVLLAWMRRQGAGHVHVHFANPAAFVAGLAQATGLVDYSLSVHGPDAFYNVDSGGLARKLAGARFVRVISLYAQSQCMRLLSPPDWGKVRLARLGVDAMEFRRPAPEARESGNNGPVRVLCVGRLVAAKGQHVLLSALALLAKKGLAAVCTLAGDGPDRQSLERRAAELGIQDSCVFTGAVDRAGVRRLLAEADVFVLPSFAEGLPVSLMEAMAAGLPCVSTRITGIPELITHGRDGWLVPAGNVETLALALEELAADPGLRRDMGRAGAETVRVFYDLETNLDDLTRVFALELA